MSIITQHGSMYTVSRDTDNVALKLLPPAVYSIGFDPMQGYYLKHLTDSFTMPDKMYGTANNTSERIITTFNDRDSSTGVSLTGLQGSGKTLIAKDVSNKLIKQNIPIIVVTSAYYGDSFIDFINSIEQEVVILFEEFEKVYSRDEQEALLSLFDGVFQNKKLFLLTSNYTYRIIDQLINRPGRLYYNFNFKGLDDNTITAYCKEKLNDQEKLTNILMIGKIFNGDFNFDLLKAIVEEVNRYPDESMSDIISILNIKEAEDIGYSLYKYDLKDKNVEIMNEKRIYTDVLKENTIVEGRILNKDDGTTADWVNYYLNPSDITVCDPQSGIVSFVDSTGNAFEFKMEKAPTTQSNFNYLF